MRRWLIGVLAVGVALPAAAAETPPAPAASASPTVARYRVRAGATVDLGWTGIAHQQPWPPEQRIAFALTCDGDGTTCTVGGGAAGDVFGAPIPLSAGGVPACVTSRLRAPLAGRIDAAAGCGELTLALTASVALAQDVARPCPTCAGDPTPNDGERGGRCAGGAAPGAPCDAHAASERFGPTSNDCPPTAASAVGELAIALAPLTTGTARLAADRACTRQLPDGAGGACACEAQAEPNACAGGRCGSDGVCPDGPLDGLCAGAPYRGCRPGSGRTDCEDVVAGAGACTTRLRPCFGAAITAEGRCDPREPVYVATLCVPATRAVAINTTAGLPGPARLSLPLARLD